jgi:RES domain-containing protein
MARTTPPAGALTIFSAADNGHAVWEGRDGGGRWNSKGRPTIYGSTTMALMLLERLVHLKGAAPPDDQHWVSATVPPELSVEMVDPLALPGWQRDTHEASCHYGDKWLDECRSLILVVPSVVMYRSVGTAAGTIPDRNVLVNPRHPEFARLTASRERPLTFDLRLFDDG